MNWGMFWALVAKGSKTTEWTHAQAVRYARNLKAKAIADGTYKPRPSK